MDGGGLAKRLIGSETGVRYFIIHFSREARKHSDGGPEDITAEELKAKFDPPPGLRTSDSKDATPVGQVRPLLAKSRLESSLKFRGREELCRQGEEGERRSEESPANAKTHGVYDLKKIDAIRKGIAQPVGTAEGQMIHNWVERPETPLVFYELEVTR